MSNDHWRTPEWLWEKVHGYFDPNSIFDPCPPHGSGGLERAWDPYVYCNPPYSRGNMKKWVNKCALEQGMGRVILLLTNAQTDASWWQHAALISTSILFFEKRIAFVDPLGREWKGNSRGQTLFLMNGDADRFMSHFCPLGIVK